MQLVRQHSGSSLSSDDSDGQQLGETLRVRATQFLHSVRSNVKGSDLSSSDTDLNNALDVDCYRNSVGSRDAVFDAGANGGGAALSARYREANEGNLYKGRRTSSKLSLSAYQSGTWEEDDASSDLLDDVSEEEEERNATSSGEGSMSDLSAHSVLSTTRRAYADKDNHHDGLSRSADPCDLPNEKAEDIPNDKTGVLDSVKSLFSNHSTEGNGVSWALTDGTKGVNKYSRKSSDAASSTASRVISDKRSGGTTLAKANSSSFTSEGGPSATLDCITDHHVKSRSNFTKRNISRATMSDQAFKNLKLRMKEKGAITDSLLVQCLQEVAEEHAVTENHDNGGLGGQDGGRLTGGLGEPYSHTDSAAGSNSGTGKELPLPPEMGSLRSAHIAFGAKAPMRGLGRASSRVEEPPSQANELLQGRLVRDPLFGSSARPYINLPSREAQAEVLVEALQWTADQGDPCLLHVSGAKFLGKTKFLQNAIDTVQSQGLGYTVLSSSISADDALTSFFFFRDIVSKALRACDAATKRIGILHDESDSRSCLQEDDEAVLKRLVQRKILDRSDRLMIGRILPAVDTNQLLSLLKGRSPEALTREICDTLFKVFIPLQPVALVLEACGDNCDLDPSSWDLAKELLLLATNQCPQLLMATTSRRALQVPASLRERRVDVQIDRMDRCDTECYIRALFCDPNCIDENMRVDSEVVDGIYDRARGCPLFTERLVLWSQMKEKEVIELDETRNSVAFNREISGSRACGLLDTLPANLNEEILEVINHLPHRLLDALKVAASIGIKFDATKYKTFDEGFHNALQEVIASHGIFCESDGCYSWKHVAVYEAVESIIISNERFEIQNCIADSLSLFQDGNFDDKDDNAQYARHFIMAERWDEAFDQFMEAGSKAEERLDFVGAVAMYEQAKMCLVKSTRTPSLRRKLSPHNALGWCLRELVRYDDAEHELEFCLKQINDVAEEEKDSEFQEIELEVVTTLATLKQALSKYSEAMEMFDQALPTARANKEKHSFMWLANHVASCAEIHRKSGDLEQAKVLHTEALSYREIAVEEHSCTVLELALSFTQLGCTLSGLEDYFEAFSFHKKALIAREAHLDFYHSLVSESLNYCADSLQNLKRGQEGIPLGMHAVNIRKLVLGPHHPSYAHALSVLAACYHSVGRSSDSLGLLKECLDICEEAFSENHANIIPNLLLYGSVLVDTGAREARNVFLRALRLHKLNFKEGQNSQQLKKLMAAMKELARNPDAKAKISPIPSFGHDISQTHVIICADIGHRPSDEYMLSAAASLQKMGILKLVSVVSSSQVTRANIARRALDSVQLANVPVAFSEVSTSYTEVNTVPFNLDHEKQSPHVDNMGVELITRVLLQAKEKSLVILGTACLGAISSVIQSNRSLFASKVKQVILIGSAKATKRRSRCLVLDDLDKNDVFTRNVYQSCQDLEIPTVLLLKHISRGFPFSSALADDLTKSNHLLSTQVKQSEEMQMNKIWESIKQLKQETKNSRAQNCPKIKAFYKYTLGGKNPSTDQHNIWPWITSVNLELVLGLLSCIPMYQDAHFRWETHDVKGTSHKISRHSNASAGIIKSEALSNEIHMLIGYAFRSALLNTSC